MASYHRAASLGSMRPGLENSRFQGSAPGSRMNLDQVRKNLQHASEGTLLLSHLAVSSEQSFSSYSSPLKNCNMSYKPLRKDSLSRLRPPWQDDDAMSDLSTAVGSSTLSSQVPTPRELWIPDGTPNGETGVGRRPRGLTQEELDEMCVFSKSDLKKEAEIKKLEPLRLVSPAVAPERRGAKVRRCKMEHEAIVGMPTRAARALRRQHSASFIPV